MRSGLLGLLSVLALAFASPASAAITTEFLPPNQLRVESDGAGDQIVVTCPVNEVLIAGKSLSPSVACGGVGGPEMQRIVVNGNGGADLVDLSGLEGVTAFGEATIDGGGGNDEIRGVFIGSLGTTVSLQGGPDDDLLVVNSSEKASGGSGDDRFDGPVQSGGAMDGETGTDTFFYDLSAALPAPYGFSPTDTGFTIFVPGTTVSQTVPWASIEVSEMILNDAPQTADGRKFSGTMRVQARGGADTIYGTELGDSLDAGADNDFIEGLGGADVYQGGSGFDRIHARDGVADSGDCGSDEDTLVADAIDVLVGCERIELPPVPPPPPAAPVPDTTIPSLQLKKAILGKKLRLRIACPENESRCAGVLNLTGVGKLGKAKKKVGLGSLSFSLNGGEAKTLARFVPAKKRDLLEDLAKPRLQVRFDVLDAVGNRGRGRALLSLLG